MPSHYIPDSYLKDRVTVALVGCGGSGSQMLTALARLHLSLKALGHPHGLSVTTYDPDTVSEANVGRQLFSKADVGFYKADVLTYRINCYYGLSWKVKTERFCSKNMSAFPGPPALVISCVDTKVSRREIVSTLSDPYSRSAIYYLDMGNRADSGQVLFGQVGRGPRLRHALEVFPELGNGIEDESTPSCSLAESLRTQSLFINQCVVTFAADLLYQLFATGSIDRQGVFVNLRSGRVRPIPVMDAVPA